MSSEFEAKLCSECFRDQGLRLDAALGGFDDPSECANCHKTEGKKLDLPHIEELAHRFFVRGTVFRTDYGGAPLVQFNTHQETSIDLSPQLAEDVKLFEKVLGIGFFYYGPRLWMVGEVTPLNELLEEATRASVIQRIVTQYPLVMLKPADVLYRLRLAPQEPEAHLEYDSPPEQFLGRGRLDSPELPILYGSQDIEVCVHECRTTVDDEAYLATLKPTRDLRLLDLSALLDEDATEFESLDMALHMLFLAASHAYPITREIAKAAKVAGFDGVIYPSYFSFARTGAMPFETVLGISIRRIKELGAHAMSHVVPNVGLFGRPLEDGLIRVDCLNKIILNRVIYDLRFGPVLGQSPFLQDLGDEFSDL
jgi:hypothetical protein